MGRGVPVKRMGGCPKRRVRWLDDLPYAAQFNEEALRTQDLQG